MSRRTTFISRFVCFIALALAICLLHDGGAILRSLPFRSVPVSARPSAVLSRQSVPVVPPETARSVDPARTQASPLSAPRFFPPSATRLAVLCHNG